MNRIRINNGIKRIEVNDNGDYITLSLDDSAFFDRFLSLYNNLLKMANEADEKKNGMKQKYGENSDNIEFTNEAFSLYYGFSRDMMGELDNLFGAGTCQKVFGDITPTFELYIDFFEQLKPLIDEFADEKKQRMNKYSAARTGNV